MSTLHPQYITDEKGKKISVVISVEQYQALLAKIEELENLRLYKSANIATEPSVAYGQASEIDGDTDEEILANIKAGVEELRLIKAGKVKTISADDFLNGL